MLYTFPLECVNIAELLSKSRTWRDLAVAIKSAHYSIKKPWPIWIYWTIALISVRYISVRLILLKRNKLCRFWLISYKVQLINIFAFFMHFIISTSQFAVMSLHWKGFERYVIRRLNFKVIYTHKQG